MAIEIHSSAIVDKNAKIAEDVYIGPVCLVGEKVELKTGVKLYANVTCMGHTTIGENTRVYPFAVLGTPAQHLKYMNNPAKLVVGKNNVIREHVTMHTGTPIEASTTIVGDDGLFMVAAHVAHDCVVGNNVIMTNNATLGGHVRLGDFAIIGGLSAVHQFCRVGKYAMVGGMSGIEQDVIPYGLVTGDRARLRGLNLIGLKRHGFTSEDISEMRRAYRMLFANEGTFRERIDDVLKTFAGFKPVEDIIEFIKEDAHRTVCQPAL